MTVDRPHVLALLDRVELPGVHWCTEQDFATLCRALRGTLGYADRLERDAVSLKRILGDADTLAHAQHAKLRDGRAHVQEEVDRLVERVTAVEDVVESAEVAIKAATALVDALKARLAEAGMSSEQLDIIDTLAVRLATWTPTTLNRTWRQPPP